MKLPAFMTGLFKNYAPESIDTEKHFKMIIKTVLSYGTWDQIIWLFDHYGVEKVKTVFIEDYYGLRTLPESTRRLWELVFVEAPLGGEPPAAKWRSCKRIIPASHQT